MAFKSREDLRRRLRVPNVEAILEVDSDEKPVPTSSARSRIQKLADAGSKLRNSNRLGDSLLSGSKDPEGARETLDKSEVKLVDGKLGELSEIKFGEQSGESDPGGPSIEKYGASVPLRWKSPGTYKTNRNDKSPNNPRALFPELQSADPMTWLTGRQGTAATNRAYS